MDKRRRIKIFRKGNNKVGFMISKNDATPESFGVMIKSFITIAVNPRYEEVAK